MHEVFERRENMRIISIIVMVAFSAMTIACAGKRGVVLTHDQRVLEVQVNEDAEYLVHFTTGQTYKVKGSDIVMRRDLVGIRFEEQGEVNFYKREQIKEIYERGGGMPAAGIGAIAGGATGAGLGLLIGLAGKCTNGDGIDDDCDGMRLMALTIATPIMAAGGAGLGALIGYIVDRASEKKSRVNVSPQVYGNEKMKITGGGLGVSGSF